jgi:2,4-dienoyl-CoA reductase-like NADH-dependent reductase (Old Yellow Enzyme family)
MTQSNLALLTPFTLGDLPLKNRVVLAPMNRARAGVERLPNALMAGYYLHLLDGLAFGFHQLGTPMQLREFREVFTGPLMGNCGYTLETGVAAVRDGSADLIAYGRPYISNPDLVERFAHGWPLAPDAPMEVWYSFTPKGYADFPAHRSC